AEWYETGFRARGLAGVPGAPVALPPPAGEAHVHHVYTVRAQARDGLVRHLSGTGIGTQVYYRIPLHRQPPLAGCAEMPVGVPETERAATDVLALPMYPELTETDVTRVVEAVDAFYR